MVLEIKVGVFISPRFYSKMNMRKCLSFLSHLFYFTYVFSLFSLICNFSFRAQSNSFKFQCLPGNQKRFPLQLVLDIFVTSMVPSKKYFYVVSAKYFSLSFVPSYSQNGFGIKILRQKGKKQVKFNTVQYNTNRIINKNGKNIDAIKELRKISTDLRLKKLINKIY